MIKDIIELMKLIPVTLSEIRAMWDWAYSKKDSSPEEYSELQLAIAAVFSLFKKEESTTSDVV